MVVMDVPEPGEPGPGEVLVPPEAVGLCGSDFHYYMGDIGGIDDSVLSPYPGARGRRHGRGGRRRTTGSRPARASRSGPSTRAASAIHAGSGAGTSASNPPDRNPLRRGPAGAARPPGGAGLPGRRPPRPRALIEPVSIAVRTVVRGRVAEGERVVVLGAGPIGQAVALAAVDRGARVLLVDRSRAASRTARRSAPRRSRPRTIDDSSPASDWAGGDGPEVVIEATGVPGLVNGLELVAPAGRVVVVGLSTDDAPIRVGELPFKEIDLLGVSCCGADDFAAAVDLVSRRATRPPRWSRTSSPRAGARGDRLRDRPSGRGDEGGRAGGRAVTDRTADDAGPALRRPRHRASW